MEIKELYKKFLKAKGVSSKYRNLAAGKKIDVSKKGLWDKKKKQVIVPSNRITMKGPNGEQDFFKKPVVATGLQSGQQVMMQPGGEYYFPNDKAVHEVRMQSGGSVFSRKKIGVPDEDPQLVRPPDLPTLPGDAGTVNKWLYQKADKRQKKLQSQFDAERSLEKEAKYTGSGDYADLLTAEFYGPNKMFDDLNDEDRSKISNIIQNRQKNLDTISLVSADLTNQNIKAGYDPNYHRMYLPPVPTERGVHSHEFSHVGDQAGFQDGVNPGVGTYFTEQLNKSVYPKESPDYLNQPSSLKKNKTIGQNVEEGYSEAEYLQDPSEVKARLRALRDSSIQQGYKLLEPGYDINKYKEGFNQEEKKQYEQLKKSGLSDDKINQMMYLFAKNNQAQPTVVQKGGTILSMGDYDLTTAPKRGDYLLPDINRPSYIDDAGERRTEWKIGINVDGKETLIPTVVGGRQLTEDEARDRYRKTGLHMGQYNTPEEADYAARSRTAKYKMLEDPINFQANQFQVGGVRRPIYTSNIRDPRIGSYRDSSNLYNAYQAYNIEAAKILKSSKTDAEYANRMGYNWNKPELESKTKNDAETQINKILIKHPDWKPSKNIDRGVNYTLMPDGNKRRLENFIEYKKPVQPYIYKKPEVVPEVVETPLPVAPIEQPVKKIGYNKPIIQQFNYMSNENKAKALQKYGSVGDIPFQGVDINQLKDGGWLDEFQEGGSVQTDITTPIRKKPSPSQDAFNAMLDEYEASKEAPEEDASVPEDMGFQSGGELPVVIDSLFSNFRSGIGRKYAQNGMAVPGVNGTVVANTNAPINSEKLKMQTGAWANWTPNTEKPYLRTSPAGNAGYSDNTKVVTQNTNVSAANRKAAEAGEYARKVGSISQGKVKSNYEKAKEATSFVAQAEQRKGSADPLDHVLDMVNPASLAFAATDLVGNTGSAVSNVAQGNFKEAGSDLLNAGINALQVIPAAKAVKPFGSSLLKGVSKYADDVVQTSKIAGKPALPTYKNVYRAEHANFNTMAKPDDLTGRWALDNPKDAEFYVRNLKTPRGDSYTTSNYFKGEVEPVRIMRDRLPEYKMKQQFAEGMPEEARIMSMGRGKLTDKELASVLGDDAADRMRKGILTEMDYNTMSTAPFMYNTTEGILDANTINKLRQGENTFLGRGKTSLFPDQKKAVDYLDAQNNSRYSAPPFTKYLPFSTYKNGGEVEDEDNDDKEMVDGVASILRRVKDKDNRKDLANQLSKQFDREKVRYNLSDFLNKSKVKK